MSKAIVHNPGHQSTDDKTVFGFWVYLMTDCILFAILFATYAVLQGSVAAAPSEGLFNMPLILAATLILLTSSFTCGLAVLAAQRRDAAQTLTWLAVTFCLGIVFLVLEMTEFSQLIREGNGWQASGFFSAFFLLVGTHGLHIAVGLLWALVLMIYIAKRGLTVILVKRLRLFSLFWHFLDIIWIFIFTIVYLMGTAQ